MWSNKPQEREHRGNHGKLHAFLEITILVFKLVPLFCCFHTLMPTPTQLVHQRHRTALICSKFIAKTLRSPYTKGYIFEYYI